MDRRTAIKAASIGTAAVLGGNAVAAPSAQNTESLLKGYVRHSVSYWCFNRFPLDEFAKFCKSIGIQSIELLNPDQWAIVQNHGLTCAMAQGAGLGIDNGWNNPDLHDRLVASYEEVIPIVARAGLTNLICFSGRRRDVTDEQGLENCERGLKRIIRTAEQHRVVLQMELLNSFGHRDYLCDRTNWGVELCKRIDSENFKLLYDIYHMQIMEGNIIETMTRNIQYIGHIHTGGNPGRNEIDETQELYYPAIMRALVNTGYRGFVGQEFVPRAADPLASLRRCISICDVAPC